MLLSFSIGTFLTNYDVTCRKLKIHYYTPLHKNDTKYEQNKSMETTRDHKKDAKFLIFLLSPPPLSHS